MVKIVKSQVTAGKPNPAIRKKLRSKYDPKHDPVELNKQEEAIKAMDARNAKRIANAKSSGNFVFDVK
jgi:hypothetical protein